MSPIAHVAQIKPRFHIVPRGTQHFWSDLLKSRCNFPPKVSQILWSLCVHCRLDVAPYKKNLEGLGQGY